MGVVLSGGVDGFEDGGVGTRLEAGLWLQWGVASNDSIVSRIQQELSFWLSSRGLDLLGEIEDDCNMESSFSFDLYVRRGDIEGYLLVAR